MLSTRQEIEKEEYELILARKQVEEIEAKKKDKTIKTELMGLVTGSVIKAELITLEDKKYLIPYEVKKDILSAQKNKFELKNLVRGIEVNRVEGQGVIGDTRDEILNLMNQDQVLLQQQKYNEYTKSIKTYREQLEETNRQNRFRKAEGLELLPLPKEPVNPYNEVYNKLFSFNWKLDDYWKIFSLPRNLFKDLDSLYDYFITRTAEILTNTANKIIYDEITKESKTPITITTVMTSSEVRKTIKDFFKTLDSTCDKKTYMSLNLFDELNALSKGTDKPLITDNPLVRGGKLLCGTPIQVIPNEIWKQISGKEILIYGDLYNSINFYYYKDIQVESTEGSYRNAYNMIDTRVDTKYQCQKAFDDMIIAEVEIQTEQ